MNELTSMSDITHICTQTLCGITKIAFQRNITVTTERHGSHIK